MKVNRFHSWDVVPREAIALQRELACKVITSGELKGVNAVAGADLAFSKDGKEAVAAAFVYSFPELSEVERVSVRLDVRYPYIPGLLSFREGPALEKLFEKMRNRPDVILFDGQGIAHPRRLGIASHMGLILDCPTIGCAKSRLIGVHEDLGPHVGDFTPLKDEKTGEVIGVVLRTRANVKPIYVSVGHKIALERAIEIVLGCLDNTRIPKPTREADKFLRDVKKS